MMTGARPEPTTIPPDTNQEEEDWMFGSKNKKPCHAKKFDVPLLCVSLPIRAEEVSPYSKGKGVP